jgi:hypothetical protein
MYLCLLQLVACCSSSPSNLGVSFEFCAPPSLLGTKVLKEVPCRASASPIDRRFNAFYVSSFKTPAGRDAEDVDNEISVQFQSVANSELWWSNLVHDGNRLGIVARHMSRRTRVQRKPSSVASDSSLHHLSRRGEEQLHGYQGRWFCLIQAPNHMIDPRVRSSKLKLAKPLAGAYSLVQTWKCNDMEGSIGAAPYISSAGAQAAFNDNKRRRVPMKSGTSELTSIHGDGDGIFNAKTSSSSVAWSSSTGSSSQPAVYNFPAASAAVSAAQLSGSSMVALPYQSTSQRLNSSSAAMSAASATMHASMSPMHAFSLTSGGAMPTSSAAMSSATTMMNANLSQPMARIFSAAYAANAAASSGEHHKVEEMSAQMLQMKRQVNDLQAQLISERAMRAALEEKVNMIVSNFILRGGGAAGGSTTEQLGGGMVPGILGAMPRSRGRSTVLESTKVPDTSGGGEKRKN